MTSHLSAIIEEEQYHCKVISNDTIKIYATTPDSYHKLIKHLQEEKIIYHTYQMNQERAYRIVIQNLHYSTPTAQITAELEKQGHKVRNILNVKHHLTKEPVSLFFIDLELQENNKSIYDMEFLCNMKITVEAPRPKKHIIQCTICQSYSHTKAYCAKPYACVKCGETTTQPHVRKHQIHQQNMRCAEVITLQATKDARYTRTCNKTEASHLTKLHTDPSSQKSMFTILTNSHLVTQTKPQLKCLLHHRPHTHTSSNKTSYHPSY
jgi:hypothetical protein